MENLELIPMLIMAIAVWRITRIFCFENGPFELFLKLRVMLYKNEMGSLISCFHCLSVWVSILLVLSFFPVTLFSIPQTFCVAGIASIIQLLINNNNEKEFVEIE